MYMIYSEFYNKEENFNVLIYGMVVVVVVIVLVVIVVLLFCFKYGFCRK